MPRSPKAQAALDRLQDDELDPDDRLEVALDLVQGVKLDLSEGRGGVDVSTCVTEGQLDVVIAGIELAQKTFD